MFTEEFGDSGRVIEDFVTVKANSESLLEESKAVPSPIEDDQKVRRAVEGIAYCKGCRQLHGCELPY